MTHTAVSFGRGSTSSEPLTGLAMTAAVSPGGAKHRLAAGGRSSPSEHKVRITGLDLARGLAVLGMIGAHLDLTENLSWSPSSWQALVYGRPAALFGVLAGVSIALLSGGTRAATGEDLVRARKRIMVRAAWVFLIGGALELLGTEIEVILGAYAVLFVLALPFLQWSPRRLLMLAAGIAVIAPPVSLLLSQVAIVAEAETAFTSLVLTGAYPVLWWWAFVLVGLALGRLDLSARRVRAVLLLAGAAATVTGYALGWASTHLLASGVAVPEPVDASGRMPGWNEESIGQWDWAWLSGAQPHTGTPFWLLASAGVAAAAIAVCLAVAEAFPRLTYPVASVGAMALTAYSLHIVVLRVFPPDGSFGWPIWLLFIAGAMVFAVAWRLLAGRGPLERLLTWSSNRAAGLSDRTPAPTV
ncbi:heparan-alpha-glucosaminide N-acetyltransferase domain-containing protein [Geodermatophilus sp. URMC 65]